MKSFYAVNELHRVSRRLANEAFEASSSSAYVTPPWTSFDLKRTIMIPEELFSSYECRLKYLLPLYIPSESFVKSAATKSTCYMGIFPQIDRAWVALNNKLFLWDYIAPYVFGTANRRLI